MMRAMINSIITLNASKLCLFMLHIVKLSVVILSDVLASVLAP
jgi:hypothetical protein